MAIRKLKFNVGNEKLAGIIISEKKTDVPSLLFIHGGGNETDKYRTEYLAKRLSGRGISSFAFDHSGSGESTGLLENSSLRKRCEEATVAIELLAKEEPLTICGSSMGGYVALKLLETEDVGNLILFCPAAYDARAFSVEFGRGFTEIIRKKESWKNSDIFQTLENFRGNLLIIIGADEEVIPKEVIRLLDFHSADTKKKEIMIIPGCPHKIHTWLARHEDVADKVANKISEFIK